NSIIRSDMPHSTVNIKVDRDGGVVVYTGASEIGQGSDTMTAQIAAEVLGCSLARVKVVAADTDLTPIDIGSYFRRVTFMAGNATLRAAEQVKKQIVAAAAQKLGCPPENVVISNDFAFPKGAVPEWEEHRAAELLVPRELRKIEAGQILRDAVQSKVKEQGPKPY